MKKLQTIFLLASLAVLFSCSKSEIDIPAAEDPMPKGDLKSFTSVPLISAQNIPIGNIFIIQDVMQGGISIIGSILSPGWMFEDNHIYLDLVAPASPAPGQFPYSGTISPFGTTLDFFISYEDLGASCGDFYIAFHAEVTDGTITESAWALPDPGAVYWYNPAGKKIGWGAYFMYSIDCVQTIFVESASGPLSTVHGKVLYQNMKENGFGEEMFVSPPMGAYPSAMIDFDPEGYLFSPAVNVLFLQYVPVAPLGLFLTSIQATASFFVQAPIFPNAGTDAIQIMVRREEPDTEVILKNVTINGTVVDFTFVGDFTDNNPPRWNITGDILSAGGGFIMTAELELIGEAGIQQANQVEISFGLQ